MSPLEKKCERQVVAEAV